MALLCLVTRDIVDTQLVKIINVYFWHSPRMVNLSSVLPHNQCLHMFHGFVVCLLSQF